MHFSKARHSNTYSRLASLMTGLIAVFVLSGCDLIFQSQPRVEWSVNQESPIISATFCCGFVPQIVPLNYIPRAQIWGDGRMIWVEDVGEQSRAVLTTTLSTEQMRAVVERFINEGFFRWADQYGDFGITDIPWQCLEIELIHEAKSVCEYYRGAPEGFHRLYDYIGSGLGKPGAPYVPERGYLTSFPVEGIGLTNTPPESVWPRSRAGISLSDAVNGLWVEDAALQTAWELVNESQWGLFIQDGGKYYQIALQIPGVSMIEPEGEIVY